MLETLVRSATVNTLNISFLLLLPHTELFYSCRISFYNKFRSWLRHGRILIWHKPPYEYSYRYVFQHVSQLDSLHRTQHKRYSFMTI